MTYTVPCLFASRRIYSNSFLKADGFTILPVRQAAADAGRPPAGGAVLLQTLHVRHGYRRDPRARAASVGHAAATGRQRLLDMETQGQVLTNAHALSPVGRADGQ